MNQRKGKVIAAKLLKVGTTKVYVDPEQLPRLKEAMTKDDVRQLIKEKIIRKRKDNLQSKARARILKEKKKKGRKRGKGKRTGRKNARGSKKERWIKNVRAQRRTLQELKESGAVFKKPVRQVYLMIKGNYFKGKKQIATMVEEKKGEKK